MRILKLNFAGVFSEQNAVIFKARSLIVFRHRKCVLFHWIPARWRCEMFQTTFEVCFLFSLVVADFLPVFGDC